MSDLVTTEDSTTLDMYVGSVRLTTACTARPATGTVERSSRYWTMVLVPGLSVDGVRVLAG